MASKISSLLGVLALVLLTGCPLECVEPIYAFEIGFEVSPEQEVYAIGDTIWIEADSSTKLNDQNTSQEVEYDGTDMSASFSIFMLSEDSIGSIEDAAHHFEVFTLIGRQIPSPDHVEDRIPNRIRYFSFAEVNGRYQLSVALVCREAGIYVVGSANAPRIYREASGRCTRASVSMPIVNDEKNLHYYQNLYLQDQPISETERTNSYCFRVVE